MSQHALRIVVYSPSIISDIGNPAATTVRAMCQAMIDLGCDVTHLEERGNPDLKRMLETRGYAPMRAFNLAYPRIRYRQYEVPKGIHRSVWFARELGTADAVVVWPGSPDPVMEEVRGFRVPQVVRFWPEGDDLPGMNAEWFNPAVCPLVDLPDRAEGRRVAVTYGPDVAAGPVEPEARFVLGAADLPGYRYLPEVSLGAAISPGDHVFMPDATEASRLHLPVALGAEVTTVGPSGATAVRVIGRVPEGLDARRRAVKIRAAIEEELVRRRV
jgi:hypothetical protein